MSQFWTITQRRKKIGKIISLMLDVQENSYLVLPDFIVIPIPIISIRYMLSLLASRFKGIKSEVEC